MHPTTERARSVLRQLIEMRDSMFRDADDDEMNTFTRMAFRAKGETYQLVIEQLRRELPIIEKEAVDASFNGVAVSGRGRPVKPAVEEPGPIDLARTGASADPSRRRRCSWSTAATP